MIRNTLLDIAYAGVLAPSADNEHVFRIELAESGIVLWPTAEFASNTEGLRRVLGLISLGAVVENMRLRAEQLGFAAQINWFGAGDNRPIVALDLSPSHALDVDELAAAIPSRHTNRRMYSGPGLTVEETRLLTAAVGSVEGAQIIWLRGNARRRALKLIWHAESERFLRHDLHQDLFSSIRFDLTWHETADWALSPGGLEIDKPTRPLFKALRHWALMRPLTWFGMHWLVGLRAGWLPAWQAPALGLLVTSFPTECGSIAAGVALERLWLRATLLDLAMQPMAASAVLMQPSNAEHGASSELRSTLELGWQTIASGLTPQMVFRMGHAAQPTVRSKRRPINDYLRSSTHETGI